MEIQFDLRFPRECAAHEAGILEGKRLGYLQAVEDMRAQLSQLPATDGRDERMLSAGVESLEISTGIANYLKRAGVHTIQELVDHTADTLRTFNGIGAERADTIRRALRKHGLILSGE